MAMKFTVVEIIRRAMHVVAAQFANTLYKDVEDTYKYEVGVTRLSEKDTIVISAVVTALSRLYEFAILKSLLGGEVFKELEYRRAELLATKMGIYAVEMLNEYMPIKIDDQYNCEVDPKKIMEFHLMYLESSPEELERVLKSAVWADLVQGITNSFLFLSEDERKVTLRVCCHVISDMEDDVQRRLIDSVNHKLKIYTEFRQ